MTRNTEHDLQLDTPPGRRTLHPEPAKGVCKGPRNPQLTALSARSSRCTNASRVRIYPVPLGPSRLNVCRWCAASAATSARHTGGRMTSPDPITQIAGLGLEPTYSAREAALLLGRSYSWLDQRLRAGQFVLPDGTVV
jgi:hypothetical protein